MLARIEELPGVRRVWMSRDGAFVVVRPRSHEGVEDAVRAELAAEREQVVRLEGTDLATVLDLFEDERATWYRAATIDRELTRIEAELVGRRLAGRVAAALPVSEAEHRRIERVVARRFYRVVMRGDESAVERPVPRLRPEVEAALRDALALGVRPLEGED